MKRYGLGVLVLILMVGVAEAQECGGCMGLSCIIRDPITLSSEETPRLVPRKTTIRVIPADTHS
jgi:hypothetical protein